MNCPLKQFSQINFIQITMKLPDATTCLPTKSTRAKLENAKSLLKFGMWHSLEIQSLETQSFKMQ